MKDHLNNIRNLKKIETIAAKLESETPIPVARVKMLTRIVLLSEEVRRELEGM